MNLEAKNEYWSETFKSVDANDTVIESKEFEGCTFDGCDFSGATFKRCNFVDCEFVNCNLSVVKIEYSKFSEVSFRDSKLIGINWTKVAWPTFMFSAPIKFYSSILSDCSFYGLSLQELVLEDCKAHSVDFREGDFNHANFSGTDLADSYFDRSNLSGANFTDAVNYDIDIHRNTITKAKFSRFEAVRLLNSLEIELVD